VTVGDRRGYTWLPWSGDGIGGGIVLVAVLVVIVAIVCR
jgi:hypothetical protein